MITQTIDTFLQETLHTLHIAVLGDVMLDRYLYGTVERISPEAPVPVNRITDAKSTLGGAANVAANLSNLGCHVSICGIVGSDEHKDLLSTFLEHEGINIEGIIENKERKTTTKIRVLGQGKQMIRLDFEDVIPISSREEDQVIEWLSKKIEVGLDGIVISDYGKGFFTPSLTRRIISLANQYNIKTIVDPKGNDWSKYEGAYCITPNIKEVSECLAQPISNEDESIVEAARHIIQSYHIKNVLTTRSEHGLTLVNDDGTWHSLATQQDVYDVSGAGDTVVAMITTCMAAGLSNRAALHISNGAAGIVVSKVGTYPIHQEELLTLWKNLRSSRKRQDLVLTREDMADQVRQWQSLGESVVFTNGCFDIIHRGHVAYLQKAAALGDHLIIGLNANASVTRLKGSTRPLVNDVDRAFVLGALACVDGVVLFEEDTPYDLLEVLRPNLLVKGGDYKAEDVIGKEWVDQVIILPFVEGFSTTGIVDKITELVKEKML